MTAPTYPTVGSSPWDASLKAYVDGMANANATFLGWSNGTDDTTTINTILAANAGKPVRGIPGESYIISSPLVVKSGTILDLTDCNITLKAASNCNMLQNAALTAQRTITDGAITTGTNLFNSPASANFTTADVGRSVIIPGAGTGGASLCANITARNSATQVVLNLTASNTVSAQTVPIYNRDNSIIIRGGNWNRGTNGGTFNNQISLFLRRVDNLLIENFTYTSTGGKFAIGMADVSSFEVRNIYSPSNSSDSVHITGPAYDGLVENIEIVSGGDDVVGVTTTDFSGYDDVHGTIDQLTIRNVAGATATRIVLLACSANGTYDGFMCQNVLVEQVRQYGSGAGVYLGSQVAGSNVCLDGINIKGVRGSGTVGVVALRAPHMGQVVCEDILSTTGVPAVAVTPEGAPQTVNIIDRLTLRNCRSTSSGDVFSASSSVSVIGELDMYDCSATSSGRLLTLANASVTVARVHGAEVTASIDPILINASGLTVSHLIINGIRANLPTTGTYLLKLLAGTLTTVTYNDPQVTAVDNASGSLCFVNSTSAVLGKMNVRGGRLDAIRNVLDHQSTGTGVTTYLHIADLHLQACNRIVQASNVTLEMSYSNVRYVAGVNQAVRIYGGGALNLRGYGWAGVTTSSVVRSASEVIHIIAQDFPADVSILATANGDTFTNTNTGANPFVAGPMVRDATNAFWVHEQGYALAGTATLVAGTVTVSNTNVTTSAVIRLYIQTPGGTVGAPFISTITGATSFVIKSTSASDTSVVRYEIVRY